MNKWKNNPVIVIGMHRSGTTMLTKVFDKLDVFMGTNVEHNSESIPFLRLNERIFTKYKIKWSNVKDAERTIDQYFEQIKNFMCNEINKREFICDYLKNSRFQKLEEIKHFGWKDPRNTFLIDIYLNLFPKAKIIHIFRNPVDVALSLSSREEKFNNSSKLAWFYHTRKFKFKNGFYVKREPSLIDLNIGFDLWKKYVERSFLNKDALHIKYESLLNEPKKEIEKILQFLSIPANKELVDSILTEFKQDRSLSFLKTQRGLQFYETIKNDPLLKELGYHNLTS
jgi:hypothetical protein